MKALKIIFLISIAIGAVAAATPAGAAALRAAISRPAAK
jgi:hypothetical protein